MKTATILFGSADIFHGESSARHMPSFSDLDRPARILDGGDDTIKMVLT